VRTVSRARHRAVRKGLVLAAGNGDRFHNANRQSKLLQPVLERPLILRTLQTARDAGVASFEVVLGYQVHYVRSSSAMTRTTSKCRSVSILIGTSRTVYPFCPRDTDSSTRGSRC
jgi:CTP:molybdopterin cytidylyltransferase MocA